MRARLAFGVSVVAAIAVACELAFPTHLVGDGCPSTCAGPNTLASCVDAQTPCALGCTADPALGARCLDLDPSGVADPSSYTNATADTVWNGDADAAADSGAETIVLDTGSGAITRGTTTIRAAGTGLDGPSGITFTLADQLDDSRVSSTTSPGLGIFGFHSLTIGKGVIVVVEGQRAAALASDTDMTIDGLVSAACSGSTPGPGGFAPDDGPCHGGPQTTWQCGTDQKTGQPIHCTSAGGGAGYATAGGAGDVQDGTHAGAGGPAFPPLDGGPFVLFGGSGGGSGNGAGGGALQLAASRSFALGGSVSACGCAGHSGSSGFGGGRGGGGAGGMIVIESPSVQIGATAIIAANGGSGGSVDGVLGAQPANGGAGAGQGGALLGNATSGSNGGGGGSAGRVVIDSLPGAATIADGGIVSPAPAVGGVTGK